MYVSRKGAIMYIDNVLKNRKNNFDVIRFLAASLVIFSHSFPLLLGNESIEPLKRLSRQQMTLGGFAVAIFFVLSGFLIMMSFDRSKSLFAYVKARALRIFPALAVVLFLSIFILGPIFTVEPLREYFRNPGTYTYFTKNITLYANQYELPGVFTTNIYPNAVNGSLWTLYYEVMFYCFVPILSYLRLVTKRTCKGLFIGVTIVSLAIQVINLWHLADISFISSETFNMIYLFNYYLGGMTVYVYRDELSFSKIKAWIAFVLMVAFIMIGLPKFALATFGVYVLFYVSFFIKLILDNFTKYGDFSYGIYIYAFPIQQAVVHITEGKIGFVTNLLVVFIITLGYSFLSWHLIEKHALKLK